MGKNRAEESQAKLQELNKYSQVQVAQGPLTSNILSHYQVFLLSLTYLFPFLPEGVGRRGMRVRKGREEVRMEEVGT